MLEQSVFGWRWLPVDDEVLHPSDCSREVLDVLLLGVDGAFEAL